MRRADDPLPRIDLDASGAVSKTRSTFVNCRTVASHGSLALSGFLPPSDLSAVAGHLRECGDCATYADQMATVTALVAARQGALTRPAAAPVVPEPDAAEALEQTQSFLMALARTADAAHADDLVQETWDHFLSGEPWTAPRREELAAYLLQHVDEHRRDEDGIDDDWTESLAPHHTHEGAEPSETDVPAGSEAYGSLRELADLDALDPDADRAELLLPELYGEGEDRGSWVHPPTAWLSSAQLLSPGEEVETTELYAVVDAALDELPSDLGDTLYLVDVEGSPLQSIAATAGRDPIQVQRELARARNHVRGRVSAYLQSR
jgi:DNA-directed RNA polymerase specialized sigma24 family protein